MTGASASVIGWAVAMSTAGLDKFGLRGQSAQAPQKNEDEDMSRPWRRQKVDAFTRRISDFSEDKKRRMPANVKTYDGTGVGSRLILPLQNISHKSNKKRERG
ncbi:hypothetical protein Tco_0354323 [Tanacetum coccineum]